MQKVNLQTNLIAGINHSKCSAIDLVNTVCTEYISLNELFNQDNSIRYTNLVYLKL